MVPGGPDNPLDPRFRQGVRLPPPPPGRPPPSPPPPSTPPPSTLTYLLAECSVGYTLSKEIMEPITGRQGKKYDHDETMWYCAPNPFVCANCTFSRINCRIRAFQVAEKGGYFALGDCRSCHHKSGQCPAGSGATGKYFVFLDKDTIMIVNKHTKEEVSRHTLESMARPPAPATDHASDRRSATPQRSTSNAPLTSVNSPARHNKDSRSRPEEQEASLPPAKRIKDERDTPPTHHMPPPLAPGAGPLPDPPAPGGMLLHNDLVLISQKLNEHTQWKAERDGVLAERASIAADRAKIATDMEGMERERHLHSETRMAWKQEKDRLVAEHAAKEAGWASEKEKLVAMHGAEKNARAVEKEQSRIALDKSQRGEVKIAGDLEREKAAHAETLKALEKEKADKERMRTVLDGMQSLQEKFRSGRP